ncbi:MAG: formylglycine-generating enzyme family protein, partial [Synechococcales bacterium]|nr:formylglycine-generating enzyme family protein [Synechococcales bacterium]
TEPEEPSADFPELVDVEFMDAQLVDEADFPPPLQTARFDIVTFELEQLERFEFTLARLVKRGIAEWIIERQKNQQAYRFRETLPKGIVLEMVLIPEGSFLMGSPEDEPERNADRESPQHEVTLEPFFMGRYPVTQAQWKAVAKLPQVWQPLNSNPSHFKSADRPVERVCWHDAVEFCARLSDYTGREYRLPTEAEWEYACRAGTMTPFHFGDTISSDLANYRGINTYADGPDGEYKEKTTLVTQFDGANTFGLSDMHGNVWEWCQDHWHENYNGAPTSGIAWIEGGDSSKRIVRGGCWHYPPTLCRSACRSSLDVDGRSLFFGFRVCCSAPRTS